MCNHATLHDVAAIGGPRTTSCCFFGHVKKSGCDFRDCRVSYDRRLVFLVMLKNLAAISEIVGYHTIIVRRHTTLCDVVANRTTYSPVLT